jgi:hypothetical protein
MKVKLAVVADAANVSQEGKLNIMGIFEAIRSPTIPARHAQLTVVVCLEADPSERGRSYTLDMDLMDEDGKSIQKLPSLSFTAPSEETPRPMMIRAIATVTDLIFPKYGDYTLSIIVDNHFLENVRIGLTLPPNSHEQR